MWHRLHRELAACLNLLLPAACLLCDRLLPTDSEAQSLCHDCLADMPPLGPAYCSCCAQPFPKATTTHLCGTCLTRPSLFSKVHAVGLYQDNLKEAVHRLKYRDQLSLAKPLGQLLGKVVASAEDAFTPDLIVPVPLHPRRLRQRGFNQALEIARPISRLFNSTLDHSLLQRVLDTQQQQGLSSKQRRGNLRNAFTLAAEARELKILLIDDVMTTGETVRECCRALVSGGISEVQVAIVGRA